MALHKNAQLEIQATAPLNSAVFQMLCYAIILIY